MAKKIRDLSTVGAGSVYSNRRGRKNKYSNSTPELAKQGLHHVTHML